MSPSQSDGVVLMTAAGWHDESPGGANKLPTDFARSLASRGYWVTYLCASDAIDRVTRSDIDGVDLRRYPSPSAPSPSLANVRSHWQMTSEIVRAVQAERPVRAVLGHSPLQYLAAARACRSGRRCYGVHSPLVAELEHGVTGQPTWRHRMAWRAAWHLEASVLRVSDVVHCDSDYTRRFMQSEHPRRLNGKAIVLPGWVDVERFRAAPVSRDELRGQLGWPWEPGVTTFFALRRLVPRMGLDTLLDAAARVAARGRKFRVVVGGEGVERSRLEALALARGIADRVAFVGRIPESRLSASYGAADCFVLPTRALECFGLIVLEAYACGVPVIGVPVGSIPEVMGPQFSEWVTDDNSAPALAERMEDFLTGRIAADADTLRRRALEFDMHAVMALHERVLLGNGAAQ